MGCRSPNGKGQFSGVVRDIQKHDNFRCSRRCSVAATFAAKEIIFSIATDVMQQNGSFSTGYARQAQIGIQKIWGVGDAAYRPGPWECTARAKSNIYDSFVLRCLQINCALSPKPACTLSLEYTSLSDSIVGDVTRLTRGEYDSHLP